MINYIFLKYVCQTCIILRHLGARILVKAELLLPVFCNARKEHSRGANNQAVEKMKISCGSRPRPISYLVAVLRVL